MHREWFAEAVLAVRTAWDGAYKLTAKMALKHNALAML
jgi:hypothetical protein